MLGPENFFSEQLAILEDFLTDPDRSVQVITIDPDLRRLPYIYLGRRDDDDSCPHMLFGFQEAFKSTHDWFARLSALLQANVDKWREDLNQIGADVTIPPIRSGLHARAWDAWIDRSTHLADSMPEGFGALVFVIDPEEVADPKTWNATLKFLGDYTHSPRVKYIVFDPRVHPRLDDALEHPRIGHQIFWMSPAEMERRANEVLIASQHQRAN